MDMLMSRSSAVRARLGNDANVSIDYIEASGDCFYHAMEAALSEYDGWRPLYAVEQLRQLVATSMTEETFQLYALLHAQKAEGFGFMDGVTSLEELRQRVQLRGQKVGAHRCVWADGFAMETIAQFFSLLLLIVDERFTGASKFTRIAPAPETGRAAPLGAEQGTVLLHASTREHMNLIRYRGKKLQRLGDLPVEMQMLWGISVARHEFLPLRSGSKRTRTPTSAELQIGPGSSAADSRGGTSASHEAAAPAQRRRGKESEAEDGRGKRGGGRRG